MSESTIADSFLSLQADPWRAKVGFSEEVALANDELLNGEKSEAELVGALNRWIQKYQPCLFGRIAAKLGLLHYCILNETDLLGPEATLRDKIQNSRTEWDRATFEGKKSGFIIVALSQRIVDALPGSEMRDLALRLCSLYLLDDIKLDKIYHDQVFLEMPGHKRTTWRWKAGVNYFCAQGDGRWWHDHRFPGGMAFSMNSVGQMVKSGRIARAMKELEELLGVPEESWVPSKVDSLESALDFAMRTIWMAADAESGKATELLPLVETGDHSAGQGCPVILPAFLAGKDFHSYKGYYHTDHTVPSEFFLPDIGRPAHVRNHILDFTYLYDRSLDNPDFITMGEGQMVRAEYVGEQAGKLAPERRDLAKKRLKAMEGIVSIAENERLRRALGV